MVSVDVKPDVSLPTRDVRRLVTLYLLKVEARNDISDQSKLSNTFVFVALCSADFHWQSSQRLILLPPN